MKTYILLVGLLISLSMSAQDIITQVNGDEIEAKVLKVSNLEVEYKKWSNTEGPTYTIPVDEIFMIKYVNGDKDVFANHAQEQKKVEKAEPDSPVITDASPLPVVNDSLISLYNDYSHIYREQKKEKKQKRKAAFWDLWGLLKDQ